MRHEAFRHSPPPPALTFAGVPMLKLAIATLATFGLGALLAYLGRRRGLAWTWSLLSLIAPAAIFAALIEGVVALGWDSATALGATLGFAAAAVWMSARGRLEDRRAGGDRESAAKRRRGVFDDVRRRSALRRGKEREALESEVPIGRDERGALLGIPRGSAESGEHVLIPGATGAGKTTSLAALLADYVASAGFGAVVLEAKSDEALRAAAAQAAARRGVPFRLISPEGPCGYDPLAHGSVDERSERLVAAQEWGSGDADFYRQAASPFLRSALEVLDASPEPLSLSRLAECLDPDRLAELAIEECPEALALEVREQAKLLRADERRAIAGMRARLRNLASSQFAGRWLDPARLGERAVDLRASIAAREVVYFRLDTDRTGNVGRAIAQMALLDLGAAASALMGRGVGTFVAIDEFGALEAAALDRLFARARAAGFSVALGTQTLADLRAAGQAVRDRVGATVSALVCHRIGAQEDAEWIAELIGTVPGWETTVRTARWGLPSEQGTRSRGHEFEVHPSELQRLGRGEAVVARFDRRGAKRSGRVRVVPVWERFAAQRGPHEREPARAQKEK
ncbi:MAG TPA: TraM recognition domain-containing protein [Solirubrobacterales bacterium]|nr:TraM recognition domain-containing protein [Solirubrobacterales bacterium]